MTRNVMIIDERLETLTDATRIARDGVVQVTLSGDRVLLGGQAVTVLKGELQV